MTRPKSARFDPATIAGRLKRAREDHGLTQEALGAKVGLSKDALRKKENGDNPFYLDEIERICDALGDAPSLFPFMEWGEAKLADRMLGRVPTGRDSPPRH